MSDLPTIHLEFTGNDRRRKVRYADGDSEELSLEPIGPGLFLLEESSLLGHAQYHDTIRGTLTEDGSLSFHEVVKPSGLSTHTWILSKSLIESDELRAILADIVKTRRYVGAGFRGLTSHSYTPTRR